jgi:hypothetical protein
MSVEFEIASPMSRRVLFLNAATTHLHVVIDDREDPDVGDATTMRAAEARQLRRFLEYVYPSSEDPPHDPDPWPSAR